jgi:hypothetical protein
LELAGRRHNRRQLDGLGEAAVMQGQAFKGRQFVAEVILWAVRWYLR